MRVTFDQRDARPGVERMCLDHDQHGDPARPVDVAATRRQASRREVTHADSRPIVSCCRPC